MYEVYLKEREIVCSIIAARADSDGLIKKQEVYEVIRGQQMGYLAGLSDEHSTVDIFIVGCCEFWEDAVRFNFIGQAVLKVSEVIEALRGVKVSE